MLPDEQSAPHPVGLYLNPEGQRRVDFQARYGDQFGKLYIADGTEQATDLLAREAVDLLVIDLERFEHSFDLLALGQLIESRAGARTLVLCPFTNAGWLPDLMARGSIE